MNLFTPTVRDQAIDTICSNLIMAGLLLPDGITFALKQIAALSDAEVAEILCRSRLILDNYLQNHWNLN